jgi:hypothetical protein
MITFFIALSPFYLWDWNLNASKGTKDNSYLIKGVGFVKVKTSFSLPTGIN